MCQSLAVPHCVETLMSSTWLGLALVSLLGPAAPAADEPPKPPAQKAPGPEKSLEDQIAAIKRDQQEHDIKFYDGLRAAGRDMKKVTEANNWYREQKRVAADKLKALIRQA